MANPKPYPRLILRPVLPLAVLLLWALLLLAGRLVQPVNLRSQYYPSTIPFLGAHTGWGVDYYQFWIVGKAQQELHPDNIYSMENRQRMANLGRVTLWQTPNPSDAFSNSVQYRTTIETFSTPFLYAAVNALASGSFDQDFSHFQTLCLLALVFSIAVLGWLLRYSLLEILIFLALGWLWCEPLAADLRVGNVNQLQLAGVALYLLLRSRPEQVRWDILSGLVLGLLVAFKPTLGVIPILLALAWIIDRRWRTMLRQGSAAGAGVILAFVAGCHFLHSWSAWSDWGNSLSDMEKVSDLSVAGGNYSLPRVIFEATGGPTGSGMNLGPALLILLLVLAGVVLFLTRRPARAAADAGKTWLERDFGVVALGCALSVAALNLAWLHYYILLIPLLLYVLRPGAWTGSVAMSEGRFRLLRPMIGLLFGLLVLATVFGRPVIFLFLTDASHYATLYLSGAWGLILLGLAALWLAPPSDRSI